MADAPSFRERRFANERAFLEMLLGLNPGRLAMVGPWHADDVKLELSGTPAYRLDRSISQRHAARIVFPEYFPAIPIEAWLDEPVLHPNVHPVNGFICLWTRHSPGDTIVETLLQIERVITWTLANNNPEHVMQPNLGSLPPLTYTPLQVPESYYLEKSAVTPRPATVRRRLFS